MRIFVDMDQTLTDFELAFERFIGMKTYPYKDKFFANLKKLHTFSDVEIYALFEKHFWAIIDTIPKFWETIPPMPDFDVLWHFLKSYHPVVLTAIPENNGTRETAIEGKRKWINKHMSRSIEMITVHLDSTNHKVADKAVHCRKTSDILIDDNELNIRAWKNKDGKAIHHTSAQMTIMQLKTTIHKIEDEKEYKLTNNIIKETYVRSRGIVQII